MRSASRACLGAECGGQVEGEPEGLLSIWRVEVGLWTWEGLGRGRFGAETQEVAFARWYVCGMCGWSQGSCCRCGSGFQW